MTYAFTFDASSCTGCKACQAACKDKNNLPVGVLWRRVYEISGGSWANVGVDGARPVWENSVFAYNLSMACNHCVHPKCAGVCPTSAFVVREDGIVYIDESKCMGCGYCAWACPYSAPQYNTALRHMTKCDFCFDYIDEGKPPACVAACPLRVLDFMMVDDGPWTMDGKTALWEVPGIEHPFPLPTFSRTQPHVLFKPHVAMSLPLEKNIANREEIQTRRTLSKQRKTLVTIVPFVFKDFTELPLVAFTLLGQMAAGMAVFSLFGGPMKIPLLLTIGGLIGLGGLASLLHLGMPLNAWRALNHLKKSWLSREILMFGLFGASWLVALVLPGMGKLPLALCGLGLVYSMAQVYHLKAAPAWNTWRTQAIFFLSAGVLGVLGMNLATGLSGTWSVAWVLMAAEAWLAISGQNPVRKMVYQIRVGCILLGMVAIGILVLIPVSAQVRLSFPIYLIVMINEGIGRWIFYEDKDCRVL